MEKHFYRGGSSAKKDSCLAHLAKFPAEINTEMVYGEALRKFAISSFLNFSLPGMFQLYNSHVKD